MNSAEHPPGYKDGIANLLHKPFHGSRIVAALLSLTVCGACNTHELRYDLLWFFVPDFLLPTDCLSHTTTRTLKGASIANDVANFFASVTGGDYATKSPLKLVGKVDIHGHTYYIHPNSCCISCLQLRAVTNECARRNRRSPLAQS